jgi:hypothetical protein
MATTSIYKDQFDIIDVQDKIKKLQIKKKKILLERDEINEEISKCIYIYIYIYIYMYEQMSICTHVRIRIQ